MSRQCFEYHPSTAYRFIPGLKARVPHESGGYLIRANSDGFRCDHEFSKARTPGKRRVLLFGDSFTAGDGVSNGHRYSEVLETLLDKVGIEKGEEFSRCNVPSCIASNARPAICALFDYSDV